MISIYSKYLLWLGIASSIAMLTFEIPDIYKAGALLTELPHIFISLLIICSPYIFMLSRVSKHKALKSLQINYAIFTAFITLSGVVLLFTLVYVIPDAQNSIAIFFLVIIQWLTIGISTLIASVLNRRHHGSDI